MAFGAFASSGPDLSGAAPRRRSYIAIILLAPGVLYLVATFIAPLVSLVLTSFKEPGGDFEVGEYVYAFRWENYLEVFERFGEIFLRTFGYSIIATIIALVVSYPLAYFIGVILRPFPLWQSLVLILVIAPFFISFLLRTLAWKSIFADEGPVVSFLQTVGVLGPEDYLNGTAFTVVFGLTYNFIPFMTLPIYASLERLDLRYVEAGDDLYAGAGARFWRIILPLSLPGVVSGTLLTFIPASGDYINASKDFLGSTNTVMAGNVINDLFFQSFYPISAAVAIVLMIAILIPVIAYVAKSGSEELL
ncbi:ABC transporter permease [Homoserinibacter gongjuensis]|jgi:spermidine/putrescine transport system permease protein|uniref:ABC transporter permease n=1 Tax=Homoserinibacter gongjuensis TaxID=1162968 RepID=A0ABQ6JWW2_9MICO|nr:ABC transporter permease [Homoserinibacter gongjuensis]GMA92197.1 ABC transporter permease [Homoserinibacter gongjuensis]